MAKQPIPPSIQILTRTRHDGLNPDQVVHLRRILPIIPASRSTPPHREQASNTPLSHGRRQSFPSEQTRTATQPTTFSVYPMMTSSLSIHGNYKARSRGSSPSHTDEARGQRRRRCVARQATNPEPKNSPSCICRALRPDTLFLKWVWLSNTVRTFVLPLLRLLGSLFQKFAHLYNMNMVRYF